MSAHFHHHHTAPQQSSGRLFITMLLNFVITAAELVGGVISGSLALISDALHNFSDGLAIIISYVAIRLGRRSNSITYTFGLKRAEIVAAVLNASTLIAISIFLIKEAIERFGSSTAVSGSVMILVASIGLAANIIGTLLLKKGAKHSLNIRSSYLHLLSDAVSSLAVITGGFLIYYFNIFWFDAVITIIISLYILKESFDIVKEATTILMMKAPASVSIEVIKDNLESVSGVNNVHHVHIWALNEYSFHFEAHIDSEDMLLSNTKDIRSQAEEILKKYGITHITLQFECNACKVKKLV